MFPGEGSLSFQMKGTTPQTERLVSHLPSELVEPPGADLLAEIVAFHNEPDRDEEGKPKWTKARVWMPAYLQHARAEVCVLAASATDDKKPIPRDWVSGHALRFGARRLRQLPAIDIIDAAREVLRRHGDVRRVLQLSWAFQLTGLTGERTGDTVWPRAAASTWSGIASLAAAIGVSPGTVAALAHMAIFIELPLADCVRAHMLDQLRAFKAAVQHHASEATALARRSEPATVDLDLDFATDVLGEN
jgi:hypothetical protein